MSAFDYDTLKAHIGHKIVCVGYGLPEDPANVAIECEDCNEVLLDYDKPYEECEFANDRTDDCAECVYGDDCHFIDGKCLEREDEE